mgnify:CR=1 FL=1
MNASRSPSAWCVDHPVATLLLTFALVLLGLIAFPRLAIAPLPEAEFPTIQVSAQLPGASPDTMASSVATPLEVQFSAIPGMTQMTSSSALGSSLLTLQFTLTKSIDTAAQEVQAAINTASGKLPSDMPSLPTWKKVNPADSPVLILSVSSDSMPSTELSDYVETLLARQISQIDGVGQINITGQQRPAIRVQASPDKLAAIGLTLADIRLAIQQSSLNLAKGAIYGQNSVSTLSTNDQLFHPEDYAQLIVSYKDGAPVQLRDIAKVINGSENAYVQAWAVDTPGVNLVITRQPGANIIATVDAIQAQLPDLDLTQFDGQRQAQGRQLQRGALGRFGAWRKGHVNAVCLQPVNAQGSAQQASRRPGQRRRLHLYRAAAVGPGQPAGLPTARQATLEVGHFKPRHLAQCPAAAGLGTQQDTHGQHQHDQQRQQGQPAAFQHLAHNSGPMEKCKRMPPSSSSALARSSRSGPTGDTQRTPKPTPVLRVGKSSELNELP